MIGYQRNTVRKSNPPWAKDWGSGRDHMEPIPGMLDPALFKDVAGVSVTTSGAAQGATTVPLTTALTGSLPLGTVLDFGGAKFARLTAVALEGATSLSVTALVTALVNGDNAVYSPMGTKTIASGTPVGRTLVEAVASALWGPAVNTDDFVRLIMYDVENANENADIEFYRPGLMVAENYLPDYATVLAPAGVASALLTKIRSVYNCFIAKD